MADEKKVVVAPEATNENGNEQTIAPVENPAENATENEVTLTGTILDIFYNKNGVHCVSFSKRFPDSVLDDDSSNDILPIRENYIRRELIRQSDDYADVEALYRDNEESIGYGSLQRIVKNATVSITKTYHSAGETYTDVNGNEVAYTEDGWSLSIGKLHLDKKAIKFLDKLFDKI